MNKKLIAAAIAAVVAAPAVSAADTTLYGKAHVSIQSNDNVSGTSNDNYTVDSNASRLGVKGSEDLGDGLKAIFGYEFGIQIDDNAGITSGRNAYLGLAGGFGTFLAGKHDTPAKVAFYAAGTDLLGDSIIDMNNLANVTSGGTTSKTFQERRLDNAIAYISPSFSGFTVAAAVVPGEATTGTNNDINNAYSLGAMYSGGGLKASVGYEVAGKEYLGAAKDEKFVQVGASYTFGDFVIGANYQDTSDLGGANGVDQTSWGVVGKAMFGNNYVMANYAKVDSDNNTFDADGFGLGVGHVFSKRTQVYAAYHAANADASGVTDPSQFALGMIHTF